MIRTQLLFGLAWCAGMAALAAPQDPAPEFAWILRTWRVRGVMACPEPCLLVENAFPVGIFEISRRPFETRLAPFAKALRLLRNRTTSSHGPDEDGSSSSLQFAEARVFEAVPPVDLPWLARPEGGTFALRYVSELDAFGWRTGIPDLVRGRAPRQGFIEHDSEPLAAFVQALRAAQVANDPGARVVLGRYPFEPRAGHWMRMVFPAGKPAVRIGPQPPAELERGAGSRDGSYLFVHYGIFQRCRGCLPGRLVGPRR